MSRWALLGFLLAVLGAGGWLWTFVAGAAPGCGPEPIAYGRDTCSRCRMHISQPGFGGELRDADGRLTKYDDVGCLLVAMWRQHREVPGAWVEDHGGGGFVPLASAYFALGEGLGTPMGFGVVAFADEPAARAFATERGATVGRVEDVLRDRERFERARAHAHRDDLQPGETSP